MLFVANETESIDWFDILASNELLENFTSTYDHLYLMKFFLTSVLLSHAREKTKFAKPSGLSEHSKKRITKYQFWCMVLTLAEKEDGNAYEWAKTELQRSDLSDGERFGLLNLVAESGKSFMLKDILLDDQFSNTLERSEFSILRYAIDHFQGEIPLERSYEEYMKIFPQDQVCSLFLKAGNEENFSRWGHQLLEIAIDLVNDPSLDPNSPKIVFPPYWEDYNIRFFHARRELRVWANKYPDDFCRLASTYLDGFLENPLAHFSLGTFSDAALCVLLEFKPNYAFDVFQSLLNFSFRTDIKTYYGTLSFIAEIWEIRRCGSRQHTEIRHRLLEGAKTDQGIMQNVLAALDHGAEGELWKLVQCKYLSHDLAKERCLAVSILPWFGNAKAVAILENLKENDPSYWVRGHADWAYEVAQQERSCRDSYRKALRESDPIRLLAILQQLKPALTPAAKWWRHQIEKEESEHRCENPRIKAVFFSFWYHWGRNNSRDPKICGRRIKHHCRGEMLSMSPARQIAPWRELDW